MQDTNLISQARRLKQQWCKQLRRWIIGCAAYVFVVGAVLAGCYLVWGSHDRALAGELQATENEVAEVAAEVDRLQQEVAKVKAALQASRAVGKHPDWSTVLVLLSRELGNEVVLKGCRLEPVGAGSRNGQVGLFDASKKPAVSTPLERRRYRLKLTGFGKSQTVVSQFVLRLEQFDLFEEVRLTKSNRQSFLNGQAVAFEIECSI